MKKTININIKGNAFQIEEDAYAHLTRYLESIRKRIHDPKEAQEVIDDIEYRLAELFRSSCKTTADIITEEMVQEVIKVMGEPSDITGEEETVNDQQSAASDSSTYAPYSFSRKLYRDPDDRILGGVCGGLGHYFGLSPIIFRILFIALIFTGITPLIYIAFWIAMPVAITVSQRMEMMGPSPAHSKTNTSYKNDMSYKYQQNIYSKKNHDPAKQLVRIFAVIFGVIIAISSFIVLTLLTLAVFFYPHFFSDTDFPYNFIHELPAHIIDMSDFMMLTIGSLIVVGIPLLVLFYLGISLIFNIKKGHGWIGVIAFLIWLGGILILVYIGVKTSKQFMSESTIRQETELKLDGITTLYLKPTKTLHYDGEYLDIEINDLEVRSYNGEPVIQGEPDIEIHRSDDPRIVIKKHARGKNNSDAQSNANKTEYFWVQNDSILQLDAFFTLTNNALIRNQEVDVDIYIPKNINIDIDHKLRWLVHKR